MNIRDLKPGTYEVIPDQVNLPGRAPLNIKDLAPTDYEVVNEPEISSQDLEKMASGQKVSIPEAFFRKAGDAALLGYSPQINAALEGLLNPNKELDESLKAQGFTFSGQPDDYASRRDKQVKELERIAAERPITSLAGSIAGGSVYAPLAAARGAGLLAKIGSAGGAAALQGAAMNPGDTEGVVDPLQLEQRGKNAAFSGLLGAGGQALSQGAGALSRGLKRTAERAAFKSVGPYAKEARQAFKRGQVEEIGRELLDQGVVGGVPTSYEGLASRMEKPIAESGKKIGSIISSLDEMGAQGADRSKIAGELRKSLVIDKSVPGAAKMNAQIEPLIRQFEGGADIGADDLAQALKDIQGGGKMGIKATNDLKREIKKLINWGRLPGADIPPEEQFYRALYGQLRQAEDTSAREAAKAAGGTIAKELEASKKTYGALSTAKGISENRLGREFANRFVSPSDYGTGAAGAAIGGMLGGNVGSAALGAGAGILNKLARNYGNQVVATTLDPASNAVGLLSNPKYQGLLSRNPGLLRELLMKNEQGGNE